MELGEPATTTSFSYLPYYHDRAFPTDARPLASSTGIDPIPHPPQSDDDPLATDLLESQDVLDSEFIEWLGLECDPTDTLGVGKVPEPGWLLEGGDTSCDKEEYTADQALCDLEAMGNALTVSNAEAVDLLGTIHAVRHLLAPQGEALSPETSFSFEASPSPPTTAAHNKLARCDTCRRGYKTATQCGIGFPGEPCVRCAALGLPCTSTSDDKRVQRQLRRCKGCANRKHRQEVCRPVHGGEACGYCIDHGLVCAP